MGYQVSTGRPRLRLSIDSTWKAPSCVDNGASRPAKAAPSVSAGTATLAITSAEAHRGGVLVDRYLASSPTRSTPANAAPVTSAVPAAGGRRSHVVNVVAMAIAANPPSGARLAGARSTRAPASPPSTARAKNRSAVSMWLPQYGRPRAPPPLRRRHNRPQSDLNLPVSSRNGRATRRHQTTPVLRPVAGSGLVALGLVLLSTGCGLGLPRTPAATAPSQPGGRPMYQVDAQHTGRSPYTGPRQPLLLRTFNTSVVPVPDPVFGTADIQSSAAVAPDGTAYIGLHNGTLFALRDPAGAGNQLAARWSFHPPGGSSWHATPAVAPDGTVYVGFSTQSGTPDAQGTLYALQAPAAGIEPRVLWTVELR